MTPRDGALADRITIRPADRGDLGALADFRCSNGHWYEDEAEKYVNESLPKLVEQPRNDYCTLVATNEEKLLGVAGHHQEVMPISPHEIVMVNRLDILALALDQQGRKLKDGTQLSDALLRATFGHAVDRRGCDTFTAVAATENSGSIAMLERHADWTQAPHGGIQYVRLSARIEIARKRRSKR